MEKDAVHDSGLAPQESGEEAAKPQEAPGIKGKEMAGQVKLNRLYGELKRWREKYRELDARRTELEERESALKKNRTALADAHIARLLADTAAAQDAINPEQVAAFLREEVTLGDDLQPLVAGGPNGADAATVEELVSQFLSRYPYHRRAKLAGGSGSTPSPSAVSDPLREQIKSAASHEELEKIVSNRKP